MDTLDNVRIVISGRVTDACDEVAELHPKYAVTIDGSECEQGMAMPINAGFVDREVDRDRLRSTGSENDPPQDLSGFVY
ncbi:hypothetical protein SAMN04487925_106148 [Bradyrhizobium sp. cf659]|nr:hypothetical protein SAMN04487925_106148 [Bradyrhizobium sp. cf659]